MLGQWLRILLTKESLLEKGLRAEKKGITRKCRIAVIGRIEILEVCGVQRKTLPVSLFCFSQEFCKSVSPRPHIPDPKPRRQGGKMAKNTASSFHEIPIELTNTQALKFTGIEEVYQEDYWGQAGNELPFLKIVALHLIQLLDILLL